MRWDATAEHVLEDQVMLLRPIKEDDRQHLLHFANEEPELWKYSLQSAAGAEGLASYIHTALEARTKGTEYPFIVFDKRAGEYAGSTRFYDINPTFASLQLGYTWYGKKFQGSGLNAHCKFLLLRFAFDTPDVERVEFRADARNERSIGAMKRIGCTVEGILRSNMPTPDGGRRDSIVLSILRDEWENRVQETLEQLMALTG